MSVKGRTQAYALELVFEGADHGIPEKQLKPKNEISYSRSVPLEAALETEVLVAWQMNGENLSPEYGAPYRPGLVQRSVGEIAYEDNRCYAPISRLLPDR
jgi:DMSO/TMAO reductase YedYZ molybdopterin-dependent catalytic subunit